MAEIYAVQNGSWSDSSTWSSGTVPTADDIVYLNNHKVGLTSGVIANAKEIRNDSNVDLGIVADGSLQVQVNRSDVIVNANLYAFFQIVSPYNVDYAVITINGNLWVEITNKYAIDFIGSTSQRTKPSVTINGDITVVSGGIIGNSGLNTTDGGQYTINGNITELNRQTVYTGKLFGTFGKYQLAPSFTINGNIDTYTSPFTSLVGTGTYQANCPIVINGIWTARGNVELEVNYISCQNVRYTGKLPFRLFYFYDINPNFTCICIDNPNLNPYILINPNSIADTYPQETDVKEGVIYGPSMEKEGILTLPIESLVMKGVEYGGDKTGTLEVIALSGATATAENIAIVNLTEDQINRATNCVTNDTLQATMEDYFGGE